MRQSNFGPVVLIIRDGWGFEEPGADPSANAIALASTPVSDQLVKNCPWNLLDCSGEVVGLPAGQMGNSEVGHLNLGAGRVVYQDMTRIFKAVRDGDFFENSSFLELIGKVKESHGRLHLVGLCSDGGVHSHIDHLYALLEMCRRRGCQFVIHCITDGRDTSPTSGQGFIEKLNENLSRSQEGSIGTISGRYFAMDRDKRWDRTEKAYRAIVLGEGETAEDPVDVLDSYYKRDITDEFIPPTVLVGGGGYHGIKPEDGVIFFNFRADRARQLTAALIASDFPYFDRAALPADRLVTMTQYEDEPTNPVAFAPQRLTRILADVLAEAGCSQLRIAETEKYAHVTYFFNGGREEPVAGEDRCLIPSPKVATYDLKPEMSASEVTSELIRLFQSRHYDFVLVNYANPDMVGHTANIEATIAAVEMVDKCVSEVIEAVRKAGGSVLVTSDHGNAEKLRDENGQPFTAHTLNPVQFIWVPPAGVTAQVRRGILADVAPTVLYLLGLKKPAEMTGESLVEIL